MTALGSSQDIDRLLAEADSLMNDMAASLGKSPAAAPVAATAPPPPAPSESESDEASMNKIVDGLAAAVETADHEAIIDRLNAERPAPPPTTTAEAPAEAPGPGSHNVPQERLAEADLAEDTSTASSLPSISDVPSAEDTPAGPSPRLRFEWARMILRAPVDLLILLDRPFVRLSTPLKSCIGYVAIATLLTAAGTAVLGSMLRTD